MRFRKFGTQATWDTVEQHEQEDTTNETLFSRSIHAPTRVSLMLNSYKKCVLGECFFTLMRERCICGF